MTDAKKIWAALEARRHTDMWVWPDALLIQEARKYLAKEEEGDE